MTSPLTSILCMLMHSSWCKVLEDNLFCCINKQEPYLFYNLHDVGGTHLTLSGLKAQTTFPKYTSVLHKDTQQQNTFLQSNCGYSAGVSVMIKD